MNGIKMKNQNSNIIKAIKGHIKKTVERRTINIYLPESTINRLDEHCRDDGIRRNRYVEMALESFWNR